MREILFRGKRVDNSEWVYGSLVTADVCMIIPQDAEWYGSAEFNCGYLVDPETVGQYIGLTDRHGKRIFEGDILQAALDEAYPENLTRVKIEWRGFSWVMTQYGCDSDEILEIDGTVWEIAGNIHDAPELWNGKTERGGDV